ncbi:MAG: hypothetical protein Q4C47_06155 [Planctomycetia bacterium]|nr:hypothetical protein [Planctomycetia bacterium]
MIRIISRIQGMNERTIVYEHDGVRKSMTRPAVVGFDAMLREIETAGKQAKKSESTGPDPPEETAEKSGNESEPTAARKRSRKRKSDEPEESDDEDVKL